MIKKTYKINVYLSDYVIDEDECALGGAECHENATCYDVVGREDSYNCTCKPGFSGNGSSCIGKH